LLNNTYGSIAAGAMAGLTKTQQGDCLLIDKLLRAKTMMFRNSIDKSLFGL
jgi:hypothetical protein